MTPTAIAHKLRCLVCEMRTTAEALRQYPDPNADDHAEELDEAADTVAGWVSEITGK